MSGEQPSQTMSVPASRQVQTPHEMKADQRTRLVRGMSEDAASERLANVARLRKARLDKEADDKAQAELAASARRRQGGPAR
jgi:hypothetical protein